MKRLKKKAEDILLRFYAKTKVMLMKEDGFGLNEVLGIAATLIVAATLITGLKGFGTTIMASLTEWWTNTASKSIFTTSM